MFTCFYSPSRMLVYSFAFWGSLVAEWPSIWFHKKFCKVYTKTCSPPARQGCGPPAATRWAPEPVASSTPSCKFRARLTSACTSRKTCSTRQGRCACCRRRRWPSWRPSWLVPSQRRLAWSTSFSDESAISCWRLKKSEKSNWIFFSSWDFFLCVKPCVHFLQYFTIAYNLIFIDWNLKLEVKRNV